MVDEGISSQKDLIAAQANNERAQAEFNYQNNISLNRELAEASAELRTAETEAAHIREGLSALDAQVPKNEGSIGEHNISVIQLKTSITGTVIERFVNPGAGVESGKPLMTITNTSVLWLIASVPEQQISKVKIGMPAQISIGNEHRTGRITYIDPRLNEDTRTARVRIELDNKDQSIKVGMFAQVTFKNSARN